MRRLVVLCALAAATAPWLACVGDDAAPGTANPDDAGSDTSTSTDTGTTSGGDDSGTDSGIDAGPFDANYYGGLELWLSADNGITPTDAGANNVGSWADRSLKNRTVTVPHDSTCQFAPTLMPSALHGLPMVIFDGETQCLGVSGTLRDLTGGFTAFAVFQPADCNSAFLGNSSALFDTFDNTDGYKNGITVGRNPTPAQNPTGDAILQLTTTGPSGAVALVGGGTWVPGTAELLEFRLPAAPAVALVTGTSYINGTLQTPSENDPTMPQVDNARTKTFVGYGANPGSGYGLYCGGIGELLIYSKALADADRQAVEAYLRKRWSL